jgi:hypothetical protein
MAFFRRKPAEKSAKDGALVARAPANESLAEQPDEPPVVARMVIEIRSDGTRTIARGALEDALSGERVAVKAEGSTPLALAASLAKTIFSAPALAGQAVKALIEQRLKR